MDFSYISLDPVPVTKPGPHAAAALRTHEGIPSMERIASGRLFAVWYAGGDTECRDNYVMMVVSDDDGKTWSDAVAVVDPPDERVRAFDSTFWVSPEGRFYWFWAQGCGGVSGTWDVWDGIAGVWVAELENPEDDPAEFRFTAPKRIANGVMMNKPTVLSDGAWALPCSVWTGAKYRRHDSLGVEQGAYMVVSEDGGQNFKVRGRIDLHDVEGGSEFDEHSFVEKRDGTVTCYMRVKKGVAESVSKDMGRTWSAPVLSKSITGPSSRMFIRRLASGRLLRVFNDSLTREKMSAWLSEDDGATWPYKLLLDGHAMVSYPDGKQTADGTIYTIHDYARVNGGYVLLSRFTEEDILAGRLVNASSALRRLVGQSNPVAGKEKIPF